MFITRVIKDHFKALTFGQILVLYALPICAVAPILLGFHPSDSQLSAVVTAVSIYSALLFGLLVPTGDQARRIAQEIEKQMANLETIDDARHLERLRTHYTVASRILSHVAFSIIISVIDVFALVITLCLRPNDAAAKTEPKVIYILMLSLSSYTFSLLLFLLIYVVRTVYGSLAEESTH